MTGFQDIFKRFESIAQTIKSFCPQYFIDGETNLWIIKPSNRCSGAGIKLERRFENIIKFLIGPNGIKQKYIIQKYIGKIIDYVTTIRETFLYNSYAVHYDVIITM